MARHRTHPVAFKRQIVQEYLSGEVGLNTLAKRHELCRHLIRVWIAKYERGELDEEVEAAGLLQLYEARIALERMGRPPRARERAVEKSVAGLPAAQRRQALRDHRPAALSVARGCR